MEMLMKILMIIKKMKKIKIIILMKKMGKNLWRKIIIIFLLMRIKIMKKLQKPLQIMN